MRLSTIALIVIASCFTAGQVFAQTDDIVADQIEHPDEEDAALEFQPSLSSPDQVIEIEVEGDLLTIPYDLTGDDDAIIQGDIILGNGAEIEALGDSGDLEIYGLFRRGTGNLWPKGVLRYAFSPGFSSKQMVRDAVNHWQQRTPIRFEELSASSGDHVLFVDANGCSSYVGRQGGRQVIRLSPHCGFGSTVHEIGHALGLGHEQMRSDRNLYITVALANIEPNQVHNFDINTWRYTDVDAYCYNSIMHYPRNAFGRVVNGKRLVTITPKQSGAPIGQRKGLAACDIATINGKYAAEIAKR